MYRWGPAIGNVKSDNEIPDKIWNLSKRRSHHKWQRGAEKKKPTFWFKKEYKYPPTLAKNESPMDAAKATRKLSIVIKREQASPVEH